MSNTSFNFSLQEINKFTSQLVLTYSNFSVEAKLSILTILVTLIGTSYKFYKEHQKQQKRLNGLFSLIWKNSTSIKKEEILGNRPFKEYYYSRNADKKVRNCLEKEKSVLIVGSPLSGKTRMVYEALKKSKRYDLIVPRAKHIDIESFVLPKQLRIWKPKIMFVDDLHRFAEQQNFEYLFEICRRDKINLIATCRSEIEYEKVKKVMLDKNIDLETGIFEEIIKLKEISEKKGKEITEKVGQVWSETRFNRTIGSIFMPLAEMHKRYKESASEEKSILKAIKKLYICGIYDEDQIFQLDYIKILSQNEGIKKENYQWEELINNLCEKEFIKIEKERVDRIWAEEVYLEDIVELNYPELNIFEELLLTFTQFPELLFDMANRAYEVGSIKLQIAEYMKISIKIYRKVLETTNVEQSPIYYAMIQNNIGNVYRTLAEVEDSAQNCKKAIEAFQNSLKIINVEQLPMDYATIQNNIGNAYSVLAEVEDKTQNCKKAIEAYQNALKIRTVEKFPIDYAMNQSNIGNAYTTLAEVEDQSQNCKKAIEALHNALKIRTVEQFPIDYAITQNNIGKAYSILARVEDQAQNCKKAIEAYQNSLRIFNEEFPIQYSMVQNNIGCAYTTLAIVEDSAQNCKKAIEAFQNSLIFRTVEQLPIDYATTQNNIGNTYRILAKAEDTAHNCKKAKEAYQNALRIFKVESPSMYHEIKVRNLGSLIRFCIINDIKI